MNRGFKQFIYGALFVFTVLFVLWGSYNLVLAPNSTCSDGIQNQGESGVDCGGPCQSCDLANLEPLKIETGIEKFSFNSNYSALVTLSNLNSNYSGDFEYRISFLNDSGVTVDEAYGSSYILPNDKDYIVRSSSDDFSTVEFEVLGTQWEKDGDISKPKVEESQEQLTDNGVEVSGQVVNGSSVSYESLSVIVVFRDSLGFNRLFFAQSVLNNFGPLDKRDFSIEIPVSESLKSEVDLENTRYYISVNK